MMIRKLIPISLLLLWSLIPAFPLNAQTHSTAHQDSRLVAVYHSNVDWNGITISRDGRVFVDFPHMDSSPGVALAEIGKDSSVHPWPDMSWNQWSKGKDAAHAWVRLNALRMGPDGNLWVVDCGAPGFGGTVVPGGAKIVVFDLKTNRPVRIYRFAQPIIDPKSYIDDIRFNGHMAYITDAGVPGLIVLNLNTGGERRILDHDRSTTDERPLLAEGKPIRTPNGKLALFHADQLEVAPGGKYLYFQPASGPLYRVETKWLDDPSIPNAEIARHVELWYDTPPTGGTAIDADGNLYVTDVNKKRIVEITPEKKMSVVVSDPRLIWADAIWIDNDGNLWTPQAELNRIAPFNGGVSRITYPVSIFKIHTGAKQYLGVPEH